MDSDRPAFPGRPIPSYADLIEAYVARKIDELAGFTPTQAAALGLALLDQAGLSPRLQDEIARRICAERPELLP